VPESRSATAEEVRLAIEGLTPKDEARLAAVARMYAAQYGNSGAPDLLQETYLRTLDGRRKWKPDVVDFVRFICEAMRSVRRELAGEPVDDGVDVTARGSQAPNAERTLAAKEALESLEASFVDDHEVLLVIEGFRERMSGPEIRTSLGMGRKEFETVRRRMLRHELRPHRQPRRRSGD